MGAWLLWNKKVEKERERERDRRNSGGYDEQLRRADDAVRNRVRCSEDEGSEFGGRKGRRLETIE